jgi:hypothetical protein
LISEILDGEISTTVSSRRLNLAGNVLFFALSYSDLGNMIYVNGVDCTVNDGSEGDATLLAARPEMAPLERLDIVTLERDGVALAAAFGQRARWRAERKREGLLEEIKVRRLADLRRETVALGDLLQLMASDRIAHAGGLAAALRKLIGIGKGNGILRDVAAAYRLPLEVVTSLSITEDTPFSQEAQYVLSDLSLEPTTFLRRTTDLDAWLQQHGAQLGGGAMTNQEVVAEFADKIGAHVDLKPGSVLSHLQSLRGHAIKTRAEQYLETVGQVTERLAQRLLREIDAAVCA